MDTLQIFEKQFGSKPQVCVRAPGRVNVIGEHIDYNGGHVLPMAISRAIQIAATPRTDGQFRLYAAQMNERYEGPLTPSRTQEHFWTNYFFGVVHEFIKLGHQVPGMDAVIDGNIPRGSGLSSSAGFEVATGWMLQTLLGTKLTRMEIALAGQRAENKFVGVNCGIMDQAISACGTANHAMLLDCNTLEYSQAPLAFQGKAAILIAHSGVHRGLSASAYNQRRGKCDAAFEVLKKNVRADLPCLCAATQAELDDCVGQMDNEMYRRARHAIGEEARVQEAVSALAAGNFERLGQILNESHQSLRDDYEVSCEELDTLTNMLRNQPGVYGSRLTGAGFGGCTVSLVATDAAPAVIEYATKNFYQARGCEPIIFLSDACEGVQVI